MRLIQNRYTPNPDSYRHLKGTITSYSFCLYPFRQKNLLFILLPYLPISNSPHHPFSSSPRLPLSSSPNLLVSQSPRLPLSSSPNLLVSPSPSLPISPSPIPKSPILHQKTTQIHHFNPLITRPIKSIQSDYHFRVIIINGKQITKFALHSFFFL